MFTGEFFLCLKRCLDDFNSHNIDAACELVVGAGAFMARQAETSERMDNMLGVCIGPPKIKQRAVLGISCCDLVENR